MSDIDSATETTMRRRLIIIGGGISGLSAAIRAREIDPGVAVTLLEATDRLGGVLRTEQADDFLIEHSADNFITDQTAALDLCRKIGLQEELLPTNPAQRRAFIEFGGRLEPIPAGFLLMAPERLGPILRSPLLTTRGKLRLAAERLIPTRPAYDPVTEPHLEESLGQFATRRLGREAFERIVQPLVSGIYSADPWRLSVAATLPRFLDMERRYGSLTAAMLAKRSKVNNASASRPGATEDTGARYSLFMAPRFGMAQLIQAAADYLPEGVTQRNSPVKSIVQRGELWQVDVDGRSEPLVAESLIVATSAPVAARLIRSVDDPLATSIEEIPLGGCSVACLGYRRSALNAIPEGFGFVVPAIEQQAILAASYSSEKFPGRAGEEQFLVRVFLGGAGKEELAERSDEELTALAVAEIGALLGISEPPIVSRLTRWHGAMPQYHVGHLALVDRIERQVQQHSGLALAGNAYRGVGIPQCIKSGASASEQLLGGV